ncbi:hypothetical protein D3C77_531750 [compost metagenome]
MQREKPITINANGFLISLWLIKIYVISNANAEKIPVFTIVAFILYLRFTSMLLMRGVSLVFESFYDAFTFLG